METLIVNILNPKAKILLKGLADLDLIRIEKNLIKSELQDCLDELRIHSDDAPTMDEITAEVEAVRKVRYESQKSNS